MNKKGLTLIELLATIVVLSAVAVITTFSIGNFIGNVGDRVYLENEKTLERIGQNYFLTNNVLLPSDVGEISFVRLDQLIEIQASEKIIDPKDQQECEGYVTVSKNLEKTYEYEAFIKCGINYETPLYDINGAMEPNITILGENPANLLMGQTYNDAGAKAKDKYGADLTSQIVVTGSVNSNVLGVYQISYTVTDEDGLTKTVSRTVNVLDPYPTVAFGTNGNATWASSRSTTVTVSDTYSGVDTSSLEYQWTTSTTEPTEVSFVTSFTNGATITTPAGVTGTYYLWIIAKNNNNYTTITRSNVFNLDNTNPVITITGNNPVTMHPGSYSDAGATATDNIDGNITSSIVTISNVTPTIIGSYLVTYEVTDSSGNFATASRTVDVVSSQADYIIVAGGGGGGRTLWYAGGGGGGGAGGVRTGNFTLSTASHTIVVGAGGAAGATEGSNGTQGGNSSAFGLTATGGGRGGSGVGGSGGSGGGGGNTGASGTVAGGSGTSGQGYGGGYGIGAEDYAVKGAGGGGGAGAGGSFSNAVAYRSGHGGTGIQWLNGNWYAGGGSGGHWGGVGTSGNGGSGIGGKGGINGGTVHATAPVANTGSGGGGGCGGATASAGAAGVVIIRYQGAARATGGTITSSGGYTYHTFTSNGTFVVN
jgi:prepilin-type N-terminal cleavage/methylation domain-containing protein